MPLGGELTIKGQIEANDTVISVQVTGFGIPEELKANFSLH